MSQSELVGQAFHVFASDVASCPSITLRGGNALDDGDSPSPFDAEADKANDTYLEKYYWGISHLDPASWRHYLPYLIEYSLRRIQDGSIVTESLIASLRPPDRVPPRLASLTQAQEAVVTRMLDALAFSESSAHQEISCQVLEEWWLPSALYRPTAK